MAIDRPGITTLRDQALGDMLIVMGLPTLLRRSPLRALAYAQAGLAYGQYGFLAWISRQSVPWTATGLFLEAWAALKGILREPAAAASGTAVFTSTATALVPAGTTLRRGDGGVYATQADLPLAGATSGTVAIEASVAGSAYTINDDDVLVLSSPLANVQGSATGFHGVAGADPELDDPFRTRMLLRWSAPPQGGDAADYLQWALAVAGVTRAWVLPLGMGAGTVVIFTMWDASEAAFLGFPQGTSGVASSETRDVAATGDLLAVANAVFPLRPATALVYSVAPTAAPVAFTIHPKAPIASGSVLDLAIKSAIDAVFIDKADPLGTELETDPFQVAIAGVAGMPDFTMTSPAAAITPAVGSLPNRGAVTYV